MASRDQTAGPAAEVLAGLAGCGLHCPPHVTLHRLLQVLGEAGLAATADAAELVELHRQQQYAGVATSNKRLQELSHRLVLQVGERAAADPAALARVQSALQPAAPPPPAAQTGPATAPAEPPASPELTDEVWPPLPEPEASDQVNGSGPGLLPWQRGWLSRLVAWQRWSLLTCLLLLWSLGMVGIGHLGHDRIDRLWYRLRAKLLDIPDLAGDPQHQITMLRQRAAAHPDSVQAWQTYANAALDLGFSADTVLAHRRLLSLVPDDADALNNLAWFLCTADDAWARDPIQGLALAEQAYRINPTPNITDTLAEAAFQNGQLERAVLLEQDALDRLPENVNRSFYERQLARFQEGLAARSQARE